MELLTVYVSDLSRYFITLFIALYTYECFAVFRFNDEAKRSGIYTRQNILMFLIHFSCFLCICFETGDIGYLFFYAFQQIALYAVIVLFRMIYPKANRLVINNMCMLLSVGFVILTRISYNKAIKQFIIVCCSLVIALLIPFFVRKIKFLKSITWIYAAAGIAALAVVLIMGQVTNGSKLGFSVFGVTFQPSEFVKIIFVFYIASALYQSSNFFQVFTTAVVAAAHVIILVISKDLGSALIFFIVYVFMVYLATRNILYVIAGAIAGSAGALLANQVFGHVQVRVQAWKDPWSVIDSAGYQITQSLFAISNGGWFGLGLYKGTPTSIPFVEADFIFSAIAEELGIIFAVCIILICVSCFIMFMNISMRLSDKFYQLIAYGLGITYIFQVFLTIGGGTKFIPLTGVTLPLISYGGSSVLTTLIMFSIIEGLYMVKQDEDANQEHERSKKKKIKGSRQIMPVTWAFVGLFLGMTGYICYYSATHKQEMINNSYNGRQQVLMAQNTRGSIYASTGEILAETKTNDTGKETRIYPYGNLFSHVVGYATNGKAGLESLGNYYLINSNLILSQKAANEAAGRKNPGDDIYTTLRVDLQEVASRSLGVYKGAIIVTEPSTGKILAMVSKPDFNPEEISYIWEDLINNKSSTVLLNRATQGLYPPGSTFKIITGLEYIKENEAALTQYSYNCNGYFTLGNERINCYHGTAHGQVGLARSFAKSCNSSFANIGLSLNRNSFSETLDSLMFGKDLPLSINYSKSYINVSEDVSDVDIIQTVIGQGTTLITPIHLNMITCAIANNGVLMKPYLMDTVKNSNGNIIKQFIPSTYKKLINENEAKILQDLMAGVVTEGTATKLDKLSYTAAGKTGSAEFGEVKGESHAWFTGYAPADNPQICVTIIIEGAGAGGDYAVPIAKRIFDTYFE